MFFPYFFHVVITCFFVHFLRVSLVVERCFWKHQSLDEKHETRGAVEAVNVQTGGIRLIACQNIRSSRREPAFRRSTHVFVIPLPECPRRLKIFELTNRNRSRVFIDFVCIFQGTIWTQWRHQVAKGLPRLFTESSLRIKLNKMWNEQQYLQWLQNYCWCSQRSSEGKGSVIFFAENNENINFNKEKKYKNYYIK